MEKRGFGRLADKKQSGKTEINNSRAGKSAGSNGWVQEIKASETKRINDNTPIASQTVVTLEAQAGDLRKNVTTMAALNQKNKPMDLPSFHKSGTENKAALLGEKQSVKSSARNEDQENVQALFDFVQNLSRKNAMIPPETYRIGTQHDNKRIEKYTTLIMKAVTEVMDARWLAQAEGEEIRGEIKNTISTIVTHKKYNLSLGEIEEVVKNVYNELYGLGPLEDLFDNDGIADIMVNGPNEIYVELNGRIKKTDIKFRSAENLVNVCHRIASRVGRRVDESSPICDARLADGSRVNITFPPLALDGAMLTIRKFKKDKLTLEKLLDYGTMNMTCAALLQIIAASRINVLISGGTGSGKTTLLNCLTQYIDSGERIITCEDAAELQLQQPHVVRMETRPQSAEGKGEVTMRELVKNCLRMRPDRILVGEVRGPEAFDLLQAMNTGHDGSMGTLHANNPRESLSRLENMIAMANLNIPATALREQISAALEVIVQTQRLNDGSRKITHISEVIGMEGAVITTQELMTFKQTGFDNDGNIQGEFVFSGLRPKFFDKAQQYGFAEILNLIMMS